MFFSRNELTFPNDLAAALEKALRLKPGHGPALRTLWQKLAKGRGQIVAGEQHYSFRREEASAYAAYYLPANCLKPALVLEENFLLGIDPIPGTEANWLDLGTGPGSAFWGLAWWCAKRGKKLNFTGWDQSPQFTAIARDLATGSPFGAKSNFLYGEDPLTLVRKLKPTHLSLMNSIAEIFPDEEKRFFEISKLLRALAELEKKDGRPRFLLVVEPGSRESSRELARLKDRLQEEKLGQVLLPCLDARPCGALEVSSDWCHEETACEFPGWLNELGAEAGLRKEALLFSYAWIRAGECAAQPLAGGLRMVSQRMERKGQVECRMCTPTGKIATRVQRSKSTPENEFFLNMARGDLWISAEIGEKGDVASAQQMKVLSNSVFLDGGS